VQLFQPLQQRGTVTAASHESRPGDWQPLQNGFRLVTIFTRSKHTGTTSSHTRQPVF